MNMGGLCEELAVGIRRACVATLARSAGGCVQVFEELAELLAARPGRVLDQSLHELREERARNQVKVLREHAPDALEDEVAQGVRALGQSIDEALVEISD